VKETKFKETVIAKNATTELKKIEELQQLKAEWNEAHSLDDEMEFSTYQETQREILAQEKTASSSRLISARNIQNEVPVFQKVEPVETEMVQLPATPEAKRKGIVTPISMNTYKTTLDIPTRADSPLSHEKFKLKQNTSKSSMLFTVQVGAYKTKAYAENLSKKLVEKGYNAFVIHKKIYKVQIDKFKNKQDAIEFAKHIQKKEKLKNFVTRTG
jgi:cell division septation protein DedD